ncbi:hypothetical protein [Amycolatopsis sp. CA-230715]|uniref:hypothetical protein n=1 Tax=Amycolatopsis sp. CA-230715 TaxID=2745196 RepID=UPI001C01A4F9|nr:hypothetical protein [Amycolatopsis sp. CA-230715]QWF85859.1 hypothetical protein HUW46_09339 [Amycolatopsis sp. CA-230715]
MDRAKREMWKKCAAALCSLELPDGFGIDELLVAVSRQRGGRPILARPADLTGSTPLGLVVQHRGHDTILYPRDTTVVHQRHCIAHEIGHLALGHLGDPGEPAQPGSGELDVELVLGLIPDLHPSLRGKHRTRATYGDLAEREAEQFATMVHTLAMSLGGAVPRQREEKPLPAGLRTLFDASPLASVDHPCGV